MEEQEAIKQTAEILANAPAQPEGSAPSTGVSPKEGEAQPLTEGELLEARKTALEQLEVRVDKKIAELAKATEQFGKAGRGLAGAAVQKSAADKKKEDDQAAIDRMLKGTGFKVTI